MALVKLHEYDEVILPKLICLNDVETEDVAWLWPPYIPKGKLTLLEGDPGLGKTWFALALTAAITRGEPFYKIKTSLEAMNVIYMTAEDGLADTIKPRLINAGGDTKRFHVLDGFYSLDSKTNNMKENYITLQNITAIEETFKSLLPALLVVDPIQGFLSGIDMNKANEVRPILKHLADLAKEYQVAILLVRHLGKSSQDRAIYRGLGSIDFAAAARSILLVGEDPQDKSRVVTHSKSSLAPAGSSLSFELREGSFFWRGESDLTADDILAPSVHESEEEKGLLEESKDFLIETLSDGRVAVKEIIKQGRDHGFSVPTLRRAKKDIARPVKDGKAWYWELIE